VVDKDNHNDCLKYLVLSLPAPAQPVLMRKPKQNHPWRQGWQNMKVWIPKPRIAAPLVGIRPYASP